MDREAWHAAVHGVAKSWTQLSNWASTEIWGNFLLSFPKGLFLIQVWGNGRVWTRTQENWGLDPERVLKLILDLKSLYLPGFSFFLCKIKKQMNYQIFSNTSILCLLKQASATALFWKVMLSLCSVQSWSPAPSDYVLYGLCIWIHSRYQHLFLFTTLKFFIYHFF